MTAKRKPLPRPCPQCGIDYGTIRIIIYNPRWSYTPKLEPPIILAIGHYNPQGYKLSKKKYNFSSFTPHGTSSYERIERRSTKIRHNFQIAVPIHVKYGFKSVSASEIFNSPNGSKKKSKSFPLTKKLFDKYTKEGWPTFVTRGAHFLKKGGLVKCNSWYDCSNFVRTSEVRKFEAYSLCDVCYGKATRRESENYV